MSAIRSLNSGSPSVYSEMSLFLEYDHAPAFCMDRARRNSSANSGWSMASSSSIPL